jgi:beta subunit of N-acylethanolamine-hydrolyzing acid amidase
MPSESSRTSSSDLPESHNLPDDNEPPLYRIDLDLQPRFRHRQICEEFAGEIRSLISLFDDVLALTPSPRILKRIAKYALRRVYSKEETEEIRGISVESGVELYLVVAYNTFLDLFSGCISGGVKVASSNGKSKMVHFRGLDWDMEQLRKIIIRVEYVRGGAVVARYAKAFQLFSEADLLYFVEPYPTLGTWVY